MPDFSIDTFAEVRARLDAGQEPTAVFASIALGENEWRSEAERLLGELADEVDRGEFDRVRAFKAKYRETWTAITGSPPGGTGDVQAAPAPIDGSAKAPEAPVAVAISKASYQVAEEKAAKPLLGSTTMSLDLSAVPVSLPFKTASGPAVPPPVRPPPPRIDTGTWEVTVDEVHRVAQSLRTGGPTHAAGPATGEVTADELRNVIAPMSGASSRTLFSVDPSAPRAAATAVPFRPPTAPPHAMREDTRGGFRSKDVGQYPPTALPPEHPAFSGGVGLMPLEEYARIFAVLRKEANPTATFARLGIQPENWMAIARAYAIQFATDPALQQRFDGLVNQNLQMLR
jgi:hypothetical protein